MQLPYIYVYTSIIMKNIKNVLLWGYHGNKNIGDDIFASVIINYLNESYKPIRIFIPLFPVEKNRSNVISINLKKYCIPGEIKMRWLYVNRVIDTFILGGGNLLDQKEQVEQLIRYRDKHNFRQIALGIGIDTSFKNSDENRLKCLLDKFTFISFRDKTSYQWAISNLSSPHLVEADDLAYLYNLPTVKSSRNGFLGISICSYNQINAQHNDFSLNEDQYLRLIESIFEYVSRDYRVVLFSLCGYEEFNDEAVTQCIKADVSYDHVTYRDNIDEFITSMAKCSAFIGMRLHGSVLASMLELPLFMLSYHKKCQAYSDSIKLRPDNLYDIYSNDHDDLKMKLFKFLDSPKANYNALYNHIEAAKRNFRFITA